MMAKARGASGEETDENMPVQILHRQKPYVQEVLVYSWREMPVILAKSLRNLPLEMRIDLWNTKISKEQTDSCTGRQFYANVWL